MPISLPIRPQLQSSIPTFLAPAISQSISASVQQVRNATGISQNAAKYKRKNQGGATAKKRKPRNTFKQYDLKDADQFALVDAMRYIRAFEVGQAPTSAKYEMHIKLRTLKNGPTVRNRLRLPHPVRTDTRIAVVCPPDSKYADAARKAGASVVGEGSIFNAVKEGVIEFDRLLCQQDSLQTLTKAGLGRILGPRGLMPSAKAGTVVKDPATAVREMVGASEYRERQGVVRLAVGQLAATPDEVQRNIKAVMEKIKSDCARLSDSINKEVAEVVLSSTHAPGFSLTGEFKTEDSIPVKDLTTQL